MPPVPLAGPHAARPAPRDLRPKYGHLAKEAGLLDHNLQIVCLGQALRPWAEDIAGSMPPTIFEVEIGAEDFERIFGEGPRV